MSGRCPICGAPLGAAAELSVNPDARCTTQPFRPFCSRRCKLLDLGNWLDERYRIATPVLPEDEDLL